MFSESQPFLLVTGAHLAAEALDRPWAYWLQDRVRTALETRGLRAPDAVVVCSDLWYLNQDDLRAAPTVSIGAPAVNALSAYLASRLPSVVAVDGAWVVLMDPVGDASLACCWGKDQAATGAAVEAFADRHLDPFLDACARAAG